MTAGFYGSRLVDINVGRLHGYHAFVGLEHAVDDRRIGLRAAHKEEDVGLRALASCAYLVSRLLAPLVEAIRLALLAIRLEQMTNHFRMRSVVIIAFERNLHRYFFLHQVLAIMMNITARNINTAIIAYCCICEAKGRKATKMLESRSIMTVTSLKRLMFTFSFSSLLAVLYPAMRSSPLPKAMIMLITRGIRAKIIDIVISAITLIRCGRGQAL